MKKKKLALFDLDDTLFHGDTEGEWVKYMDNNGLIRDSKFFDRMDEFTRNYRQGRLDVYEYSEFLLSPLVGKSLKELKNNIDIFSSDVVERLTDDLTKELLDKHKDDVKILTSGSLTFLVNEIASKLGISISFGTDPEYTEEVFTGKVDGIPNFSEEKVRRIKNWMKSDKFDQIFAYSDSIHDLPLLEFSHFPFAVTPDSKLRKIAEESEWFIDDRRKI